MNFQTNDDIQGAAGFSLEQIFSIVKLMGDEEE